jgi:ribosome-binding factor A
MPSLRNRRIAEAIREIVSTTILREVADPRVRAITVLGAEVSGDLRNATVAVSIMGSETEQRRALQALQHAAGFFQSRLASQLSLRNTPILTFKRDDSVKKSFAISRLIDEAIAADRKSDSAASSTDPEDLDDDELEDDPDTPSAEPPSE